MTPHRLVRGGWLAFAVSGVFFIISGVRARDPFAIVGSIVWLVGVSLFLLAMERRGGSD